MGAHLLVDVAVVGQPNARRQVDVDAGVAGAGARAVPGPAWSVSTTTRQGMNCNGYTSRDNMRLTRRLLRFNPSVPSRDGL